MNKKIMSLSCLLGITFSPSVYSDTATEIENLKIEIEKLKVEVQKAVEWKEPSTLVHLSGYADVGFVDAENSNNSYNIGSFSPIFHYQYRDIVMLESELELEVEADGSTKTSLDYLTIDLFINDYITFITGKFLSPIGQFRQNLHPSWINKLPSAPPGYGHDGAAPLSEMGVQLRGGFPIANVRSNYALYISNGPELITEYDGAEFELDGIAAEGKNVDIDNKKVIGGRFGILPIPSLEIAISAATGKTTVTSIEGTGAPALANEQARDYTVTGMDFAWQLKGFYLRGEYVHSKVAASIVGTSASDGAEWTAWYTQAAYQFYPTKIETVIRYSDFDSVGITKDQKQWTFGVNYLFANNVIGKVAYELNDGTKSTTADDDRLLLQLAYGF
ncbi:hypothetical protein MNBD_GAMMA22-3021 [hydrothermal vent metagenome]|uniref:Porin n=1 Tax=hydrothermal vent metagenome TaxID=652676 RepID=A0A3B0ZUH2_9ZZZZ